MASELKQCGCKGIRRCLLCAEDIDMQQIANAKDTFVFCPSCSLAYRASVHNFSLDQCEWHKTATDKQIPFPGVSIFLDFVSPEEESRLAAEIDCRPWVNSQSGRRKQDYGPKANFKKRKVKVEAFEGFPPYSEHLVNLFSTTSGLKDFCPVEQCNLDYDPTRGSAIDPHFDDRWLWGERLVTLSLLELTFLTMSSATVSHLVHLPMPRRSLIVLRGPARHEWMHEIRHCDVVERRIALTFRELAKEFLPGGDEEIAGAKLLAKAERFDGLSLGEKMIQ